MTTTTTYTIPELLQLSATEGTVEALLASARGSYWSVELRTGEKLRTNYGISFRGKRGARHFTPTVLCVHTSATREKRIPFERIASVSKHTAEPVSAERLAELRARRQANR